MNSGASKYEEFFWLLRNDVEDMALDVYNNKFYLIEIIITLFFAWLSFRLGRFRSKDQLLEKIQLINSYQSNKSKLTEQEAVLLRRSRILNKLWWVLTLVIILINVSLHWQNFETNKLLKKIWIPPLRETFETAVVSAASFTLLALLKIVIRQYEKFAKTTTKTQLSQIESQEASQIDHLMKVLGEKALEKLKLRLCKDLLLKIGKEASSVTCRKEKCYNLRRVLKESYDLHSRFIKRIFEFRWCDRCMDTKRQPDFYEERSTPTESPETPDGDEHAEVSRNLVEIQQRCARLINFLNSKCKNLCRTKYWKHSKDIGLLYKQEKSQNLAKLRALEQQS